jgi:glycosyltransferase involved in cell wall biosynthesis
VRISYVNGLCVKHDAISNAIRDEINWLLNDGGNEVCLFTYDCCHPNINHTKVDEIKDVVFDPYFQTSDLIIFHFGIFYELFDILPVCPRKAKRLIVFHNITPKKFIAAENHPLIDKSFQQMANMEFADHIICVSNINFHVLRENGIETPATVIPLAARCSASVPVNKPSAHDGRVRIAFVGRFVRSKGPDEMLNALYKILQWSAESHYSVDLIGNLSFSDSDFVAKLYVDAEDLRRVFQDRIRISFHGNASNELKDKILQKADLFVLPTYHEGFCVPILEALANGCRIIAYENSNTPFISGGLGQLVPTGDVKALADAIFDAGNQVVSPEWTGVNGEYSEYSTRAFQYTRQFSPELVKRRFLEFINGFSNIPH